MTVEPRKLPLSVYLVTLNEETHLEKVLASVQFADEIIVVDSGSVDKTCEIAQQYGARLIHQDWLGFAKQKAFAMAQCTNNWVLNLDGDEILPADAYATLAQIVNQPAQAVYELRFEDVFWGKPMASNSAKRHIVRLFDKNAVEYPSDRQVHENVLLTQPLPKKQLNGMVTHFGYQTTYLMMAKQNRYAQLKAEEKHSKNKRPSLLKLAIIFPVIFIKSYVFRRMFLSGRRGWVQAHIEAMYAFLKEANLAELAYRKKNSK